MRQGDLDWWRLADTICTEDRPRALEHNAHAAPQHRLELALGPVPCAGAIMTAPVVVLLSHPLLDAQSTPDDYSFRRAGWPLAALHPEAPRGIAAWWRDRLGPLIDRFGAQHVSNAVAAAFLTPWRSIAFDDRLRLPSRQRMLDLGASAAARDAFTITLRGDELWTEHAAIAALPPTRRVKPGAWRLTEFNARTIGDDAWSSICRRIEVHAWI
jgi:hypothetical protein